MTDATDASDEPSETRAWGAVRRIVFEFGASSVSQRLDVRWPSGEARLRNRYQQQDLEAARSLTPAELEPLHALAEQVRPEDQSAAQIGFLDFFSETIVVVRAKKTLRIHNPNGRLGDSPAGELARAAGALLQHLLPIERKAPVP
jgi:hypothetical protein